MVTTKPLPDTAPIEVTPKSGSYDRQTKEREYCMRLFQEPEFVQECMRNRTWKR